MPGINANPESAVPGLTLRAWAMIEWDGATATLRKGSNVASIARSAVGKYTLTLTAAMANTLIVGDLRAYTNADVSSAWSLSLTGTTTAVVTANTFLGTVATDPWRFYVGIYG